MGNVLKNDFKLGYLIGGLEVVEVVGKRHFGPDGRQSKLDANFIIRTLTTSCNTVLFKLNLNFVKNQK